MNIVFLVTICAVACAGEYMPDPEDPYNADTLPDHPEEMKARVDCFLDQQPCDNVTTIYKGLIPDLVRQECSHCSPYIKHYHNIFIRTLKKDFYQEYEKYRKKFDPEGIHFDGLEAAVSNY